MVVSPGIRSSPATATINPGWQAIGLSASSVERASGHHAANLLVCVDEASGVEDDSWDAIESLGYSRLLVCGNPLRGSGKFFELCEQGDKDERDGIPDHLAVKHFNMPSWMSPHAHLDRSPVGMADRTWLESVARNPGKDSLWYQAHVDSVFPKESFSQMFKAEWLDRAISRETEAEVMKLRLGGRGGRRVLSCDVGEGVGNARSVVMVRDDLGFLEIHASKFEGPVQTATTIATIAEKWNVPAAAISFDGGGMTGVKLANALKRYYPNLHDYRGSGSGGKNYTNLRTATAAAFARRLNPEHYTGNFRLPFHIPNSPHLPAMLEELKQLRYRLCGAKSECEDKQLMSERLGRSPDFLDSAAMTFRDEAVAGQ